MRLHTITLGCQMSAADSEEMGEPLRRRGWTNVAEPENAEAILISTCTVRQHAEDRALSLIGSLKEWKEKDSSRVLIVAGCAAQKLGPWLNRRFPHVDLVVGAKSIEDYPAVLEEALGRRFDAIEENARAFGVLGPEQAPYLPTGSSATGYLTIMRGCNYSCSYCIVPSVRGRELYRPAAAVLEEARLKASQGIKELMLLGQTVNSYRSVLDGRPVDFARLLRLLDKTEGIERLRFMSPHPYHFDAETISAMAECRAVCEFVHLPVQSGSDRILKRMRRSYTRASFMDLVEKLRRAVPGVVFSTDIIVGFPSETDEDFRSSLELLEELRPAVTYGFKFSPRRSTEAAAWPDDVPQAVKEERLARLNALVDRLTQEALDGHIGTTVSVLAEQKDFGRTRTGFKVRWEKPVALGASARVKILSTTRRTLLGEIHEPPQP